VSPRDAFLTAPTAVSSTTSIRHDHQSTWRNGRRCSVLAFCSTSPFSLMDSYTLRRHDVVIRPTSDSVYRTVRPQTCSIHWGAAVLRSLFSNVHSGSVCYLSYTLLFEFSSLCQAFTVRATTLEDWPATSPRDAAAVTPRSYII